MGDELGASMGTLSHYMAGVEDGEVVCGVAGKVSEVRHYQ
jgi:hypothetical protein